MVWHRIIHDMCFYGYFRSVCVYMYHLILVVRLSGSLILQSTNFIIICILVQSVIAINVKNVVE